MTAVLALPARAKINLELRVVGRRADGYHDLETVFDELELHDDLTAVRAERGVELALASPAGRGLPVAAGDDNLVCRAARAFLAASGLGGGFRFGLTKRIPAGGGLGGGSSDAAAALRLCQALTGAPLAPGALHEVACALGADVPYFLRGGRQRGTGVGDVLEPRPRGGDGGAEVVLFLPPFGTSTAEVFRALRPGVDRGAFGNDLEPAARAVYAELGTLLDLLRGAGVPARLSGSGSTVFALGRAATERVEGELARRGVRVITTRFAAVPAAAVAPAPVGDGPQNP